MSASQAYRVPSRRYGVNVPIDQVQQHLLNGWEILSDAEDIREHVLMRPRCPAERARWFGVSAMLGAAA